MKVGDKQVTHLAENSSWNRDRVMKLAVGVLFGAVGGGALALGALSAVGPLGRAVKSAGGQLALVLTSAALGGAAGGLVVFVCTLPEPVRESKRSVTPQDEPSSSSTSSESDDSAEDSTVASSESSTTFAPPPATSGSSSSAEESEAVDLEARVKETDFTDKSAVKATARALAKHYEHVKESDGEQAAQTWLDSKDGPVESFLSSAQLDSVPLRTFGFKRKKPVVKKGVLVRKAIRDILTRLVPPKVEGKATPRPKNPTGFQLRRAMAYYQTLVDAFGDKMAAALVGDTFPIVGMEDKKTRDEVRGAKSIEVEPYVAPEYWQQCKMHHPGVQRAIGIFQGLLDTVWSHGNLGAFEAQLLEQYGILHRLVGEAADTIVDQALENSFAALYTEIRDNREVKTHLATLDQVRGQKPLRFYMEGGTPKLELDRDVCSVIAGAVDAQRASHVDPRKDQYTRESVIAMRFGGLERLASEEMVDGIESFFSKELWNFHEDEALVGRRKTRTTAEIKGLYQLKIGHSDEEYRLQPEHFDTIRETAKQAGRRLRRRVERACKKLPAGYDAPLRAVSEDLIAKWQQMAALVTLGDGEVWDEERQRQYRTVYEDAHAQMVELKRVMEITEEYIGIDENFCEELARLFYGISIGADRAALRNAGETLRAFLMHRQGQLKRHIGGGREGVMPVLLEIFRKRLEAKGVSHRQLQLRTDTRSVKKDEDWVPVAWGLSTKAEREGNVSASASLSGHHFINYIQTGKKVTRLDNMRSKNPVATKVVHSYEPDDAKIVARADVKLFGSEAALFVHCDVVAEVLEALEDAGDWSTLSAGGNNCFISSAVVLLTAFYVAGSALDPDVFVMDPVWIEDDSDSSTTGSQGASA